jgi:signal transduction histidine kinase
MADCVNLVRAQATQSGLTLVVDMATSLPRLRADELRLKQIVLNLLSNAVKFSRIGGRVGVTARLTVDGTLILIIHDDGIGMDRAEIETALKPFRQVESSLARRYTGTGLGLPLAKSLIEKHGGTLRIDSARNVGTTVTVMLPAERLIPEGLTVSRSSAAAE